MGQALNNEDHDCDYWIKGEDYTECFGTSIGYSASRSCGAGALRISLENGVLEATSSAWGGWSATDPFHVNSGGADAYLCDVANYAAAGIFNYGGYSAFLCASPTNSAGYFSGGGYTVAICDTGNGYAVNAIAGGINAAGGFYCGGTAGVTGIYLNPTLITISGGIVTAIS